MYSAIFRFQSLTPPRICTRRENNYARMGSRKGVQCVISGEPRYTMIQLGLIKILFQGLNYREQIVGSLLWYIYRLHVLSRIECISILVYQYYTHLRFWIFYILHWSRELSAYSSQIYIVCSSPLYRGIVLYKGSKFRANPVNNGVRDQVNRESSVRTMWDSKVRSLSRWYIYNESHTLTCAEKIIIIIRIKINYFSPKNVPDLYTYNVGGQKEWANNVIISENLSAFQ